MSRKLTVAEMTIVSSADRRAARGNFISLFRMRMTARRAELIEISEAENLFVFGTDEANADVEDSGYVRATFQTISSLSPSVRPSELPDGSPRMSATLEN